MKLPKFLQFLKGKSSDDEEEDEDFDFSESENDAPHTTVIDDGLEQNGNLGSENTSTDMTSLDGSEDPPDIEFEASNALSADDDPLFNDDGGGDGDDDDDDDDGGGGAGDVAANSDTDPHSTSDSDDEPIPEFDLDDAFPEDGVDEGDGEDGEHHIEAGGNRTILYVAGGFIVVVLGIIGGAGYWFLDFGGDETKTASKQQQEITSGSRVELTLPPRSKKAGTLNAGTLNNTDNTPVSEDEQKAASAEPAGQSFAQINQQGGGGGSLNALSTGTQAPGTGIVVPATTVTSFNAIPNMAAPSPLTPAPVKELLEEVAGNFTLPKIGADGSLPWQVYARPYDERNTQKKVAIMVTGLGLSRAATRAAISKLPPEVSLVFSPYAKDLEAWIFRARRAGHEAFVRLPMESKKFPLEDAGPLALSTSVQMSENMRRLNTVLGSFGGYVGVVSLMGSKFVTAESQLKRVLQVIKKRGLMFVDFGGTKSGALMTASAELKLPIVKMDLMLDKKPYRALIDIKFLKLEDMMKSRQTVIATISPYPSSIERLAVWAKSAKDKDLYLVPVSSIVGKQ